LSTVVHTKRIFWEVTATRACILKKETYNEKGFRWLRL
jgi:hypothetical protein